MAAKRRKKRARKRKHAKRKVTHRKRHRAHRAPHRTVKRRRHKKASRRVSHGSWKCHNCRVLCVNRGACWSCGCAKAACAA